MADEGSLKTLCFLIDVKPKLNFWLVSLWGIFWRVRQCLGRGKEEEVWGGSGERALIQALCPAEGSVWVLT